ncbi:MAG: NADH-quinone oxidoreductase subunit C [Anaerolineales bacterium]|nr:NADH-quinone oxidoreductase subunit C [Anaerolineales bacterium]
MSEENPGAVQAILDRFEGKTVEFRDQLSVVVPAEKIAEVCLALRDEFGFNLLSSETAVDYWPENEPRFHIIYQLLSIERKERFSLRTPVSGSDPSLPTIEGVYANANWFEREIFDMFGVRFEGHSDMRRILMPHDWEGHPLRKDYPLGYEEVQFTFNFDEIDVRKPYAKE